MLPSTLRSAEAGNIVRRSGLSGGPSGITWAYLRRRGTSGFLLSKDLLETGGLIRASAVLLLLQVGQTSSLGVDLVDLSAAIRVELGDLLAGGRVGGLLKVRV